MMRHGCKADPEECRGSRGGRASTASRGSQSVAVRLPAGLTALFPGAPRQLDLQAENVAAALGALDERWPGMRDRICDSRPGIRRHINVFVNGERAGLETPLAPGDEVIVMTAISGG